MAFANPVSLPSGYRVTIVRNTNIDRSKPHSLHASRQGVFATIFRLSTLRMDLGLGRWIYMVLRQHGSAWCFSGPLKRLAFSRIISREAWETQNHQTFPSISLLGTLGPGDRRLCTCETCACVIHTNLQLHYIIPLYETLHDRPFLLHLKRASETQNHLTFSYRVPEH